MHRSILSICNNLSLNFLFRTSLSKKYQFIQTSDVYHGVYELKKREDIELIIVDIDYHTQENIDFIHHINSSGFYQLPMIVVGSDKSLKSKIPFCEGNTVEFVLKPFNPQKLVEKIDECMSLPFYQNN